MKIGIDVGGSKIEGVLLDKSHSIIDRSRITTPQNYSETIKSVADFVFKFEKLVNSEYTVGIGIPGVVSMESHLVKNANSNWLIGKPLKKDIESILSREVRIENDANCFTLSESFLGNGKNYNSVFGVILGTGVGGGISINKKIIYGKNLIAGEWGHTPLPWVTEAENDLVDACYCGMKGCIETYLSAPGFAKIHNNYYKSNKNSMEIVEDSKRGDKHALDSLEKYIDRLARALSSVINILDPEIIILGGGMSNVSLIYPSLQPLLRKYVFSDSVNTKVIQNKHGDSSGVIGAALLWD